MNEKEFVYFRKKLNKTQKQMAQLLGSSIKAIHSYEQGWRKVPAHAERQIFFLLLSKRGHVRNQKPCWVIKKCPPERKEKCPAWEFRSGKLCWFINGTICEGVAKNNWREKIKICKSCEVFSTLFVIVQPQSHQDTKIL